jgi:hypothetical protein
VEVERPQGKPLGGLTPHPKEIRQRAFALYQEGKPFVDIAHEIRVAAPTIRCWALREKWRQRVQIARENPKMDDEAIVALAKREEPLLEVPPELSGKQALYQTNMQTAAIAMSERVKEMGADEALSRAAKIKDLDAVARKALKLESDKPVALLQLNILTGAGRQHPRSADPNVALRHSRQ